VLKYIIIYLLPFINFLIKFRILRLFIAIVIYINAILILFRYWIEVKILE